MPHSKQSRSCTAAGEGDVAKLAAKLAERDGEVFHHYSYVQQANLGIQDLTKQISERFHRASTASAAFLRVQPPVNGNPGCGCCSC
jgi:hypothetical protein